MTWSAYTETMQQLAVLRRNAERESSQHQASYQAAQQQWQQTAARVAAQKTQLSNVAQQLQLPPPWLDGIQPGTAELAEALVLASQAATLADAAINEAVGQSAAPRLLPKMTPNGRAATVYGAWSAIGWLTQCGLVVTSGVDFGAALWSLCGLPALAFFAGFITLQVLGQPRIGGKIHYSLKLGGAITFIGMPLAWVLLVAFMTFLRT